MFEGIFSSFSFEPLFSWILCLFWKTWKTSYEKPYTFPSMTVYLGNAWEQVLCKINLCLSLGFEFIRIGCQKTQRTHVYKNDGLPWSRRLAPRHEALKQGMLELAEGEKKGSIFNGFKHRPWRWASYYVAPLPFTICVILSKLLILSFKVFICKMIITKPSLLYCSEDL